ncbi:hypothetical protein Tco_0956051 [Tanacetum coccineum]|uniref:Uncharacterized protein n=1 Tax=Tanacetum coccineum TaxID=301880 RepID=A0ABQ5E907_9ASTR
MAASAIAISSDSSDESVGSPPSRVILFGDIPTVIPSTSVVAPETSTIAPVISSAAPVVETTLVASPTGLCGLVPYSDSDSDSPDEMSSPEHISPLPAISPFLCTDSSEAPDSSDGPPSQDPYVATVARWRSRNFANKMTHPHPNRRFVPQAVLTRSGKINTAGASVNTVDRPVNTVGSKITVNHPRPISNAYKKGYSQVTKPFNKYSANKNSISNKKVNTVKVKDTTARDRAVGNPQQKEYKEKGVIDSGCSRHMTGNK